MVELLQRLDKGNVLKPQSRSLCSTSWAGARPARTASAACCPGGRGSRTRPGTLNGYTSDVGYITLPNGRRIAVAMFARGGTNRPRTIAEAARAIYDGFTRLFTWPAFGERISGDRPELRFIAPPHHRSRKNRPIARSRTGRPLSEAHCLADQAHRAAASALPLPPPPNGAVTILLDEKGEALSSVELAKKLEQWRDRGKREARFVIGAADGHSTDGARGGRPPHVLRTGDLAAPARPGDARRAIVPRDINPCEPPLSSRRLRRCTRLAPLLRGHFRFAARCVERPRSQAGEPLEFSARRALAEARAAEAQVAKLQKAADQAQDEVAASPCAAGRSGRSHRGRRGAHQRSRRRAAGSSRLSSQRAASGCARSRRRRRRFSAASRSWPSARLFSRSSIRARREEFVRVRLLLDSTLPVIRARTASLRAELEPWPPASDEQRKTPAPTSSAAATRSAERKQEFAALEAKAAKLAEKRGGEALGAGDVALARGEEAAMLTSEVRRSSSARQISAEFSRLAPPRARPGTTRARNDAPFAYQLPAPAPVTKDWVPLLPTACGRGA